MKALKTAGCGFRRTCACCADGSNVWRNGSIKLLSMELEECGNSTIPFFWKARTAAARMWRSVDVQGTSTFIGGRFGSAGSTALARVSLSGRFEFFQCNPVLSRFRPDVATRKKAQPRLREQCARSGIGRVQEAVNQIEILLFLVCPIILRNEFRGAFD